jgi:hypothetical protein
MFFQLGQVKSDSFSFSQTENPYSAPDRLDCLESTGNKIPKSSTATFLFACFCLFGVIGKDAGPESQVIGIGYGPIPITSLLGETLFFWTIPALACVPTGAWLGT